MKRNALLAGLVTSLLYAGLTTLSFPAKAQDAATTAEREEREANYKRMLLKVEGLEETLQAQTKLITSLASKVNTLRDDLDRLKSREDSSATQEAFKRLAEKDRGGGS
jgi:TolA-binding protein